MPLVPTVAEKITREIASRLAAYEESTVPVFAVYRTLTDSDRMTPTTNQVVVRQTSNARFPTLDRIANPPVIAYQMTVSCYGQVMISESDAEAAEGHAFEVAGKIIKAVVTGASWYTMGGVAINAAVGETSISGEGAYYTGKIDFIVTYRVRETDPFTAAG